MPGFTTGAAGCQPGWIRGDGVAASMGECSFPVGTAAALPAGASLPARVSSAAGGPATAPALAGAEDEWPCVGAHSGPGAGTEAWATGPDRSWMDNTPSTNRCMNAGESFRVAAAARALPFLARKAVAAAHTSDMHHQATMPAPATPAAAARSASAPGSCCLADESLHCATSPEPMRQSKRPSSSTPAAATASALRGEAGLVTTRAS